MKINPAPFSQEINSSNRGVTKRCWINVIIPNYNSSELIKKNLLSVIDSLRNYPDFLITIVDDGSLENDYLNLKDYIFELNDKRINLIRENKNKGFSSAVNKGAFSQESDFLVILNTDVSPERDFLKPVISDFQNIDNLFGVGCLDKSIEGKKTILRGRGIGYWNRGLVNHKRGEVDKSDTFWVSGGSSIIKTKLFKNLGGFDEIYNPFYWEDIDLSYRAKKSGYEIRFENKSEVVHSHFEGSIRRNFSESSIRKIAYRNQFIFVWKNITDLNLLLSHLIWLPYNLFKAVLRLDFAFLLGILFALVKLPDIIKKRKRQKLEYKKRDLDLLSIE